VGCIHIWFASIPDWSFATGVEININVLIRLKYLYLCLIPPLIWGCDAGGPKFESINSQNKQIQCTLNSSPLQLEISKGSLDANLFLGGREMKVNLLEVKDFYQILMRFDPNIGQLKINKAGTELIQLRDGQERIESCLLKLKSATSIPINTSLTLTPSSLDAS
jgi:hypothetical protein